MLAAFFAALKALGVLLGMKDRADAKADGAAIQRDADMRAENERIAKADSAGDNLADGGGVPVESDPFNRDNG